MNIEFTHQTATKRGGNKASRIIKLRLKGEAAPALGELGSAGARRRKRGGAIVAKPGKFILNKLIRKIAALSSEGQRKSCCGELLCCSGRALCCSGSRLWEVDGRAPGFAVLGAAGW